MREPAPPDTDQTLLDEAGEAVLRHRHVDTRSCQDRIVLQVMKPDCLVCQYDARDLGAAVLRVAEQRLRAEGMAPAADLLAQAAAEGGGSVEADLPEPAPGSEAAYWKTQALRARTEGDALALRLLQMAGGWEQLGPSLRTEAVVDTVRSTVEMKGCR